MAALPIGPYFLYGGLMAFGTAVAYVYMYVICCRPSSL
jgi:hypothetical protein